MPSKSLSDLSIIKNMVVYSKELPKSGAEGKAAQVANEPKNYKDLTESDRSKWAAVIALLEVASIFAFEVVSMLKEY